MGLFDGLAGIFDSGNHDSVLGVIGKPIQQWTDPLSWMTGGKWADWTSTDIPRASNQALSKVVEPFDQIDQTINPARKIGFVDDISNVVKDKPASAIGAAIGSIFAAPAIGGAMGAGGAGSAGTGALSTGGVTGGSALGYGGGVASTALPGILPGATVGAGTGAGGTFGGALGTGAITGVAGGMFGPTIGAGGMSTMDAIRMMNQGRQLMQNQQQQQPQQNGLTPMVGGGGGNVRGLFSSLMQQPKYGQVAPTAGLLNLGY